MVGNPHRAKEITYNILDEITKVVIIVDRSQFKFYNRALSTHSVLFHDILIGDNSSFLKYRVMPCLLL